MSERWQSTFLDASDAVFFLNRRQRVQFVNPAWETLTGLSLADVRGLVCKRRSRDTGSAATIELQKALAPPPEVLAGNPATIRRLPPPQKGGQAGSWRWWDISFFPLRGQGGLIGILGSITPVAASGVLAEQPLPESIIAVRQRFLAGFALEQLHSAVPVMQRAVEQVRLAAQTRVPVVLVGEAGTGKHWMARAIQGQSAQRERPFARLDCQRLPQAILADAVFGERGLLRRGSFGAVYLREPASLPRELQAQLAELLTPGADASGRATQFITGFCAALTEAVAQGRLLPELFAVLGPIVIELPPLRERRADVPNLAESFLQRFGNSGAGKAFEISPETLQTLTAYNWPGNLHELLRVLASAHKHASNQRIEIGDLPFYLRASPLPAERSLPLDALLEQVEKRLIGLALRSAHNNKSKAAEILSIWRPRLVRRLEALGFADAGADDGETQV